MIDIYKLIEDMQADRNKKRIISAGVPFNDLKSELMARADAEIMALIDSGAIGIYDTLNSTAVFINKKGNK